MHMSVSNQFIKSCAVGVSVALAHLAFVFFLTDILGVNYLLGSTLSYTCAIAGNFYLQRYFVLWGGADKAHVQFVRFMLISCVCLVLNSVLMYLLVSVCGLWYLVAQVLTIIMLTVCTFMSYRLYVFR